jgi:hypothetical protein
MIEIEILLTVVALLPGTGNTLTNRLTSIQRSNLLSQRSTSLAQPIKAGFISSPLPIPQHPPPPHPPFLLGNFSTGVQLKLRKHLNAYIAIKWNLNLLVITFLTTLSPLDRVVSRNDASPSDGDNKRLVCVRGDQYHDHIKDIRKRVD